MKFIKFLSYLIISILVISACMNVENRRNTLNNKHIKNYNFKNGLSIKLINVIEEFIDSVESKGNLRPLLGIENFYYTVKFFKNNRSVFFTIRTSYIFPRFGYYDNTLYENDTTCMYYFNIHNRKVIIIDYPESKGHELFFKVNERNYLAIKEMKKNALLIIKESIRPSNPTIFRLTYRVEETKNDVELMKLDTILFPKPYNTESNNYIPVIEDQ